MHKERKKQTKLLRASSARRNTKPWVELPDTRLGPKDTATNQPDSVQGLAELIKH